jgi:chromosomal replication initiation ATPase DnaA
MYLARELLHASFGEIGRRLGDREDSTARHGYQHAQAFMITDEDFRERVQRARQEFLASRPS